MADPVATNVIVFGRGLEVDGKNFRLTRESRQRVQTLLDYVADNADNFLCHRGRIVFSGGWAAAAEGIEAPPAPSREGSLMHGQARTELVSGEDLSKYAEVFAEIESDSTLENVLNVQEGGYFNDVIFSNMNPLGLIAHKDHLARINFLVRKIFNIRDDSIMEIPTPGPDRLSAGISENLILFATRAVFVGAHSHRDLRKRHRLLVSSRRRLLKRNPSSLES